MKVSKSMLKSLVKECLVEILSDGIGRGLRENLSRRELPPAQQSASHGPKKEFSPGLRNAIVNEAKGDPILESILEDTAASTLPMMLQNDGRGAAAQPRPSGFVEHLVASASPDQIFGDDVASKWADLAFADAKQKK